MHGLDVELRVRRARHRGDGVSPRSGRREVLARRPRAPLPLDRAAIARPGRGHARPRRRRRRDRDRPPRRDPPPTRRHARRSAARPRARGAVPHVRAPAGAGAGEDGRRRRPHRRRVPQRARQGARRPVPPGRGRDPRAGGRAVQRQLDAAAARGSCSRSSGLTPVKRTKTGPSTDADSLQKMAETHPIVETLLRYREAEKLRSTYADALPPLVREDGRIHATFNQLATTTGRISSESPNLQNIPVRTVRRSGAAPRVHRRRRQRAADRRLLADRAAGARAPRATIPA